VAEDHLSVLRWDTERVQPPADVAERLSVSAKTKSVLRRENVFWADDDPVHRVTTYIP
jgi:GntR family transcriptional regulator